MVNSFNEGLANIEQFLQQAIATQPKLSTEDIDAKELCAQIAEQIRLQQYRWADSKFLPNILTVHVLEEKADKLEPLEMIFCAPELARLLLDTAKAAGLETILPMRAEVELVKRDHPALIAGCCRCTVTFTWPKQDDSLAEADVIIDQAQRRIVAIRVRHAKMPVLARLTALNAEVYRNNYLLIREITHIGRLRVVLDDKTGLFLRRNDFIFAQNDDPEAVCNSVSRQHAKITYKEDGSYYIEDSGSANSTRIERAKDNVNKELIDVKPGHPAVLEHGDIIHLGLAQVRFNIMDHIDPMVLAEISAEQERAGVHRQGEDLHTITVKTPAAKQPITRRLPLSSRPPKK
ncbi:MAG: FHA domain-containing protein [Acidobacteriota bacterium]